MGDRSAPHRGIETNPGRELVIHAALEHPLPFGFEIGAATAAFRRKRRKYPRFFRGREEEILGLRRLKKSADRSAQHRSVDTIGGADPRAQLLPPPSEPADIEANSAAEREPVGDSPFILQEGGPERWGSRFRRIGTAGRAWYSSAASLNPACSACSGSVTAKPSDSSRLSCCASKPVLITCAATPPRQPCDHAARVPAGDLLRRRVACLFRCR